MLNVNKELAAGTIYKPEIKTFTPENAKFEVISFIPPTRKIQNIIATRAKLFSEVEMKDLEASMSENFFEDYEDAIEKESIEGQMYFWAVVFSLEAGGKRAIEYYCEEAGGVLGIQHVADFCENKLSELGEEFNDLAREIMADCGMIKEDLEETDINELIS